MKQLNKKATKILIILGVMVLTIIGLTLAYYNSTKKFENEFRVNAPGVAVYEKFNPTDLWVPGEEKSKEVWFKNTGEQDMLLRFSYSVEWVPVDGKPMPNRPADEVVTLNWNIEGNTNVPKDFSKKDQTLNGKPITYYYYNKVLKAGEPTDLVLKSVKFKTDLSNDEHRFDYSDQQINLTIKGETVLADSEAVKDQWKETQQITAEINLETGAVIWSFE